jgi:hypothetical protein
VKWAKEFEEFEEFWRAWRTFCRSADVLNELVKPVQIVRFRFDYNDWVRLSGPAQVDGAWT